MHRKIGSPPRAWGQSVQRRINKIVQRFTPTGVGTIRAAVPVLPASSVHPHGRGDNVVSNSTSLCSNGSPPRAWGQSYWLPDPKPAHRFTPTGVGTIARVALNRYAPAVHPHGRGDNAFSTHLWGSSLGSPPRAWGQSEGLPRETRTRRFTPTGVGTICHCAATAVRLSVHPHGRGDNGVNGWHPHYHAGSPPRAWGQCR